MTRGSSSRRRQRSELSSASSESSSPASKRSQVPSENTSELQAASLLPSDAETMAEEWVKSKNDMWNILCEIKSDVSKILAENVALRKDVEDLKSSLQISDAQIASLKQTADSIAATVKKYEQDLKDHENSINQLEDRTYDLELNQDSLEQYTRKYNVEVHGIPEKRDENLKDVIVSIASQLDVDICSQDIDIVHRLHRKPPAIKPIIVRFSSHSKKQEFYQARFKLREADFSSILPAPVESSQSIFINENLTARRKELLAKARKLKKEKSYHRVWTMDGKIFLRIAEGTKTIQIREEDDLDKFK